MTEDYLHYIWKNKRIPINLKLIDGREISICDFGNHNRIYSGPDFSMGTILLDGLKFVGPIELHVKSSDWYSHNHHKDDSYNNVTLHVVNEYDIDIIQAGRLLPTLELKNLIDKEHYLSFVTKKIKDTNFICEKSISNKYNNVLELMKSKALELKLNSKWKELNINYQSDPEEIFYKLLARSFGMGTNKIAFQKLSNNIDFQKLKGLSYTQIYNLLMSESNLISNSLSSDYKWDYCGTRPANFPHIRISQLSLFIANYQFEMSILNKKEVEMISTFKKSIELIYSNLEFTFKKPGKSFYRHLLINVIAPLIWLTKNNNNFQFQKHIDILKLIPFEKNNIIKKWQRANVKIKNAYDSQALLALTTSYCSHKKCLSCAVGEKILNRF